MTTKTFVSKETFAGAKLQIVQKVVDVRLELITAKNIVKFQELHNENTPESAYKLAEGNYFVLENGPKGKAFYQVPAENIEVLYDVNASKPGYYIPKGDRFALWIDGPAEAMVSWNGGNAWGTKDEVVGTFATLVLPEGYNDLTKVSPKEALEFVLNQQPASDEFMHENVVAQYGDITFVTKEDLEETFITKGSFQF